MDYLRKQNGLVFFHCDIPQTITMITCGLLRKNLKRVASKQGTPPSVYPQDALESELIRFRSGVARFRRNRQHPPHRALYSAPDQHPPPNRLLSPFLSCSVSGAFYQQALCVRTIHQLSLLSGHSCRRGLCPIYFRFVRFFGGRWAYAAQRQTFFQGFANVLPTFCERFFRVLQGPRANIMGNRTKPGSMSPAFYQTIISFCKRFANVFLGFCKRFFKVLRAFF